MIKEILRISFLLTFFIFFIEGAISQEFSDSFETRLSIDELNKAPAKLIPYPKEVVWKEGIISFRSISISNYNDLSSSTKTLLDKIFGKVINDSKAGPLRMSFKQNSQIENEGYILEISENIISIQYNDLAGQFYALQTLRQLIRKDEGTIRINKCSIKDAPKYEVRGFMLDVGRNYMSLDLLKEQLEIMSQYKLNYFQWHLTDRPAWRIENKRYPELTAAKNHVSTRNPGMFYTYEEIRELIAFAKELQIKIIPEIDMPGHSDSFTTAMGFKMDSNEGMTILEDILNEFFQEIPEELAPIIHLGSDEVKIKSPKEFMDRMVGICEQNNRKVVVWNPGLATDQNVIRQTWRDAHQEDKDYLEIDSWSSYINNSEPMTAIPKLLMKSIGGASKNKVIGGILCMWPDVRLEDEKDFIAQNPLYPGLITYSWATWTADVKSSSNRYLTMLPSKGSKAFSYYKAFESYLLDHKRRYFNDLPFQYSKQTQNEWLLSEPMEEKDVDIFEKKLINGLDVDKSKWNKAVGNTIIIKDRFNQGGYYPKAKVGTVVFATSSIHAEENITIKAWIGFETPLRANRTYTGIAKKGEWDINGGSIWINGEKLLAPKWTNPGWKPTKQNGWGSKKDQEIPWAKEELYWTRKPLEITLTKGENIIIFKVPSTHNYQNWMFTFAPL